MSWLELRLRGTGTQAEALEQLLWDCGAVSVTLTDAEDEPLLEPGVGETPLWHDVVLTGLFEGDTEPQALELLLHAQWHPRELPPLEIASLEDRNWVRTWLDDFRPMRFGERLWVCPSWWKQQQAPESEELPSLEVRREWSERHRELLERMQRPDQCVMLLDPGLAFGTGTHPTTSLCLQWLDGTPLAGQHLIDFGCGSGILGIAALLLGADSVTGVDNDPQALTATLDNCAKNAIPESRFPVRLPEDFAAQCREPGFEPADGVVANILAGTLIQLSEQLTTLVRPSGWILLSGILSEQSDAVIDAFRPHFDDFDVATEGDWVRIAARRLSPT